MSDHTVLLLMFGVGSGMHLGGLVLFKRAKDEYIAYLYLIPILGGIGLMLLSLAVISDKTIRQRTEQFSHSVSIETATLHSAT